MPVRPRAVVWRVAGRQRQDRWEPTTVETCAISLPNTDSTEADLLDGITPANPEEVGAYMADPQVRFFSN